MCRLIALLILGLCAGELFADPWQRHTIDDGSRGADGVRLGDFDRDGFLDVVTGWEEGGRIRICFQPGEVLDRPQRIRRVWPAVTVGVVESPEDAMAVDMNGDGWLDVVSCCEGSTRNIFIHLNPGSAAGVRDASAWKTRPLLGAADVTRWMFCVALDKDLLVAGSKNPAGQIALCDLNGSEPRWQMLRSCHWIMSLRVVDVDQDGHPDILYSDRKGPERQVGWLQNPGEVRGRWADHQIGGAGREMMFLDIVLAEEKQSETSIGSQQFKVACNTKDGGVLLLESPADVTRLWTQTEVLRPEGTGSGKGVAWGDIDLDGKRDLVCTCEHAGDKVGVYWMKQTASGWDFQDISGKQSGTKFDRIEMLDVDLDGDLDVITCEERNNLGVIWYENPRR